MIEFREVSPESQDAQLLLEELRASLIALVNHDGTQYLNLADFAGERGTFLVGYRDGVPMCCAGIRMMDEESAEVRRVYARKNKEGIGSALITAVGEWAAKHGYCRLLLQSREANQHAIAFYEKNGFVRCEKYPPYDKSAIAVCLSKQLM